MSGFPEAPSSNIKVYFEEIDPVDNDNNNEIKLSNLKRSTAGNVKAPIVEVDLSSGGGVAYKNNKQSNNKKKKNRKKAAAAASNTPLAPPTLLKFESTTLSTQSAKNAPLPRGGCTMTLLNNSYIVLGGADRNVGQFSFDVIHRFDSITSSWSKISLSGSPAPSKRYGHSAISYKNTIYVFGGKFEDIEEVKERIKPKSQLSRPYY